MPAKQVAIAVDQLLNALVGGWADETLSARCWRCRNEQPFRTLRAVIDGLFFWEEEHCLASYMAECFRLHVPPEERELREISNA